ncbi:hypothetical protein CVT25_008231 [Psilocybe cyanescens]|uniref:Uncharacterized protein n=1 Tax=Psilocybe cyanescens TaxID=93625 RepID=A0A409X9S7_PSICY|nr:hypothetical protein CVT25_008231 [Psilocybe cyanescens]
MAVKEIFRRALDITRHVILRVRKRSRLPPLRISTSETFAPRQGLRYMNRAVSVLIAVSKGHASCNAILGSNISIRVACKKFGSVPAEGINPAVAVNIKVHRVKLAVDLLVPSPAWLGNMVLLMQDLKTVV